MMVYLLSLIYLMLWSLTSTNGSVNKAGIGEKPLMYQSIIIEFILSISPIFFIISTIALLFYNWKLTILLNIIAIATSRAIFEPLVIRLFLYPIYSFLEKKGKEIEDRENQQKK